MYYDVIQCDVIWHERTYVRSFNVISQSTNYSSKLCYKIRCDVVLRDVHVVLFVRTYFPPLISCHFLFRYFHSFSSHPNPSVSFISLCLLSLLYPSSLPPTLFLIFSTSYSLPLTLHHVMITLMFPP